MGLGSWKAGTLGGALRDAGNGKVHSAEGIAYG